MNRLRRKSPLMSIKNIFLSSLLLFCFSIEARVSQFHARFGLTQGSYDGPISGTFSVPTTLDVEYESFFTNRQSFAFRALMAMEMPEAKPVYTYFGTGWRGYLSSKGPYFERSNNKVYFVSSPTTQFHMGVDVGFSQVIVESFGDVLQIIATMFEVGIGFGASQHLTRDFAVEGKVEVSSGYGISSVGLLGITGRIFFGATYYF